MIEKVIYVGNQHVNVSYDFKSDSVFVIDKITNQFRAFGGWDGLMDSWEAFADSFSMQVTYDDALNYFRPNVNKTVI